MTDQLLDQLAEFAVATFENELDSSLMAKTSTHVLDTIGVAMAGAGQDPVESVRAVVSSDGGREEATVYATGERLPAANAAFVNGTMAHALDYDDTHLPSVLHPSASVVPAAIAAAETADADGLSLLKAVAVGIEITCRLGMAAYDKELGTSTFFESGLHATSICGTLGAAASCALLFGADVEETSHAIAVAASMGAGLIEANRSGGTVKPAHCGWAAHGGMTAARLSLAGMTGPPTVLEGRFGFFRAHTGESWDRDVVVRSLGEFWELERLFIKPYPTNHFTHAGIDAALAIRAEGLKTNEVVEIRLGVPGPVLRTIAEPPAEKAKPKSGHHAKFSGPFTVAVGLSGGSGLGVSQSDFTDAAVENEELLKLAALVHCIEDEESTAIFPCQFPALLEVDTSDGRTYSHRVSHNRGGPGQPLTWEELVLKFTSNVAPVLGETATDQLIKKLSHIETLKSIRELPKLLSVD